MIYVKEQIMIHVKEQRMLRVKEQAMIHVKEQRMLRVKEQGQDRSGGNNPTQGNRLEDILAPGKMFPFTY